MKSEKTNMQTIAAVAAVVLCLLTACNNGQKPGGKGESVTKPLIELYSIVENRTLSYDMLPWGDEEDEDSQMPQHYFSEAKVNGIWPGLRSDEFNKVLHKALIKSFFNDSVSVTVEEAVERYLSTPLLLEDDSLITNIHEVDSCMDTGEMNISYKSLELEVHTLCQRYATFECFYDIYYAGAAHGLRTDHFVTFDLERGKVVTLDDLISNRKRLAAILTQKYLETRQMGDSDIYLTSEDDQGRNALPVYDNFFFGDWSLMLVYQPYDIGCYAEGEQVLEVPLYELIEQNLLTDYAKELVGYE